MKTFRSFLALFLALTMVISLIPGAFAVTESSVEEYVPVDPYVYQYGIDENGYEGPEIQYVSPYVTSFGLMDKGTSGKNIAYSLYNTVSKAVIPAYSIDYGHSIYDRVSLGRRNMDDSSAAIKNPGVVRAIMLEGFYLPAVEEETEEEGTARAEAKLAALREATGISDLTIGEAIAATQLAIWQSVYGEDMIPEPVVVEKVLYDPEDVETKYYDLCYREVQEGHLVVDEGGLLTQETRTYVTDRIMALYNYLLALEPVDQTEATVSEESFGGIHVRSVVCNEDGTYDITVEVYVKVDMAEGDLLTLTAMADSTHYVRTNLKDGYNEKMLTIENVPGELIADPATGGFLHITVAIDGIQTASRIIYLDVKDGRKLGRSMVAMEDGPAPVHVEMEVSLENVDSDVPQDPFIYQYEVDGNGYEGPANQYASPYITRFGFMDKGSNGDSVIYTLYNTVSKTVLPAYCIGYGHYIYDGVSYAERNMDDSNSNIWNPGLVRAIMEKGFYLTARAEETEEEHSLRVEYKLSDLRNATGISDLTAGEAIAATQLAIWKAAYGEDMNPEPIAVRKNLLETDADETKYFDLFNKEIQEGHYAVNENGILTDESRSYVSDRILTLYDYFMALEPVEQNRAPVSEESFGGLSVKSAIRNQDGTYDITVEILVKVDLAEGDRLTLTAMADANHYAQTELADGRNNLMLTIEKVPAELIADPATGEAKCITVAIDGIRDASQIIYLEAKGGNSHARSMIAMEEGFAPVHVEKQIVAENIGNYVPQNSYVYTYGIKENDPYRYLYFSPYNATHEYANGRVGSNSILVHSVYNSITEISIPAYCADIGHSATSGMTYRRLNIEDSRSGIREPEILRAIMEGGFYLPAVEGETEEENTVRAEAKLAVLREATGISDLTVGEAITATQLAVWKAVHGADLLYLDMLRGAYEITNPSMVKYYDLCNAETEAGHYTTDSDGMITEESKAYISQRIETLYNYLMALEPVDGTKRLVSEESFGGALEKYTVHNQDGTYDICIEISVSVDMDPEDRLTLTAMADPTHYVKVDLVDGANDMFLTIENVPAELIKDMATGEAKPMTVSIDGMQSASQVIYLEAKDGKYMSQSMVAVDNSYIPVHEEVPVTLKTVDLIPELKVGRSLNLESNISINYVIPANLLADYSEYSIHCYMEGEEEPYVILPQEKNGYVYFTFDQLTALNMNDMVNAYLHVSLGRREAIYDLGEYSVAAYAYTLLNKETTAENVKVLCANLLRYGAKAQLYKEYKVDDLPDAGLTAEQRAYLTDPDSVEFSQPLSVLPDLEGATVTWTGSSMSLESTIAVKLVVNVSKYAGDPSELELHVSYVNIRGEEVSVVLKPSLYNEKLNLYAFTLTQLNAAELRSELTCRVYAKGEAVSQTKLHCAASYGNNKTGTILELCQVLFAYVDCAKAVFG